MKKITAAVLCFICATLCGCGARDSSIQQTAQQSETSETDLQNISSVPEVEYLSTESAVWVEQLKKSGSILVDFNGDGREDSLSVEYGEIEGETYIEKLEVRYGNFPSPYVLENYRSTVKNLESGDINMDGIPELILCMDSGTQGGNGSMGLLILCPKDGEIFPLTLPKDLYTGCSFEVVSEDGGAHYSILCEESGMAFTADGAGQGEAGPDHRIEGWADGAYQVKLVQLEGKTGLEIYQYIAGNSHTEELGDAVTGIVWEEDGAGILYQYFEPCENKAGIY
ncbi:hypothetical protein [Lachnotalea sp. AF33-28]|jgi:hypothetical protein|uniref:hypothetical protein n=1 Tax=Lachnotalea sp. AF33-28 TaxID=2292046 RepID=UPI000E543F01|nr:hypothetical protein [Lachnotalea sp. AF33-28]RHP32097.1 hypothetical protein DWZ56_15175 [Lachnotalea sp. AF33-28]